MKNVLVISNNPQNIQSLTAGAAAFGGSVSLIFAGEPAAAVNAEKAFCLGSLDGVSYAQLVPQVAALAAQLQPDLVLTDTSRDGRLAASAVAVALGCSVVADAMSVRCEDGAAVTERMVYGGSAIKTEKLEKGVIVCGPAVFEAGENSPAAMTETAQEPVAGIALPSFAPRR